ncbi:MAG: DUF4160 domain-containing protein [Chitinophagaceae bacterium]|nr:DUF4160 domain-containing protein [Cytophagales bacterium]MCA6514849.1 DUF4160 domain-containing protein [Chitinophagaceae bacterium]
MPTLCTIESIKIDVYAQDHPPPHFHVRFAEYEVLIEIKTLQVYKGTIPPSLLRKIINWARGEGIQPFLLDNYLRLNPIRKS